jgi:hypothetical protein
MGFHAWWSIHIYLYAASRLQDTDEIGMAPVKAEAAKS